MYRMIGLPQTCLYTTLRLHWVNLSCLLGGDFRDVGPALKHYCINVRCLLVYFSSDVIDPDNVCVIGQGMVWSNGLPKM